MEIELISNFKMPPFARIQWASKKIKDKYEPMFKKAQKFYHTMEKLSVEKGLRTTTTDHVYPGQMIDSMINYSKRGMHFLPLHKVGEYSGVSSYHPPVKPNSKWSYYGVVSNNIQDAEKFAEADGNGDHKTIGRLLGFPDCCIDIFKDKFTNGINDLTWFRALNTDEQYVRYYKPEINTIKLKNVNWRMNTIMKPFIMGALFHETCSFSCEETLKLATSWYDLGNELNVEGLKEVELFLRMPYTWDSFKGIAYIKSPLFKCSVNSTFTKERYIVRLEGSYYPTDAPRALEFPWDAGTKMLTRAVNNNKLEYWEEGVK